MRVLVVENEKRLAARLRHGLEADGFDVEIANDSPQGLQMAREHRLDAIVLNSVLPGMSGHRMCETLRADGVWTPILVLTDPGSALDVALSLGAGADGCVTKPFSIALLLGRLRALLPRGARERSVVLAVGDLSLDRATHRVTRAGVEVRLTPRELSVLEYLMRHAGEVVGKREILDHIWDYDFGGTQNIVEVYVRQLRNKLDRPFGRRSIETLRGSGYRLVADGPPRAGHEDRETVGGSRRGPGTSALPRPRPTGGR